MTDILTIGEIIVEIMAKEKGQKFDEPGEFLGPFPSGAPAIFIHQAAKLGSSAGIISTIGLDAFGQLNYKKLKEDGVHVSYINKTDLLTTGVAFVTYKNDGDRDFIYHLNNSASSLIEPEQITEEMFHGCRYFHIMGSALFNQNIRASVKKVIQICKTTKTKISFDPNLRKELLKDEEMKKFLEYVLEKCDIFLPSEEELSLFTSGLDEYSTIRNLLDRGLEYVVIKRGSNGCTGYSNKEIINLKPYKVTEIDPTGAGDCFAGTLISCLNQGKTFREALEYANAAGAHAVTKRGPMEGNAKIEELEQFRNEMGGI